MRRHRWLLVLGFVLVLSGCSGTQLVGVSARDDGSIEVRSYCSNEGLTDVRITSDVGVVGFECQVVLIRVSCVLTAARDVRPPRSCPVLHSRPNLAPQPTGQ